VVDGPPGDRAQLGDPPPDVVPSESKRSACWLVEDPNVRCRVGAGAGDPLPALAVGGQIAIHQVAQQEPSASGPRGSTRPRTEAKTSATCPSGPRVGGDGQQCRVVRQAEVPAEPHNRIGHRLASAAVIPTGRVRHLLTTPGAGLAPSMNDLNRSRSRSARRRTKSSMFPTCSTQVVGPQVVQHGPGGVARGCRDECPTVALPVADGSAGLAVGAPEARTWVWCPMRVSPAGGERR
jgi:hypothetical protein